MPKKILVVGKLLYGEHEENFILPILSRLEATGCEIKRVGREMDFFLPKNYPYQAESWIREIPFDFKSYDVIFVTDFWFPALPIYVYQAGVSGKVPPIVGMHLGSSWLEGDFVENYPHALDLERYLTSVYSRVIVAARWVTEKLPKEIRKNRHVFSVFKFPMDRYLLTNRPEFQFPARKVIFNARWEHDKAPERFFGFAQYCKGTKIEFVSFNNPDKDELSKRAFEEGLIRFTGYPLQQHELEQELQQGGYVWNHSRQELIGYGTLDMVSKGLTPLLYRSKQLQQGLGFPNKFYFKDYADALEKIETGLSMSAANWKEFVIENRNNADKIAQAIMEVM